ncbi:MAG: LCP family protein [Candidatus Saccharibacteria bacterium]|nr:LCP family protein [Candidatus Saccharibacteria bacterium]
MSIDGLQTRAERAQSSSSRTTKTQYDPVTYTNRRVPVATTRDPFALQRNAKGYGQKSTARKSSSGSSGWVTLGSDYSSSSAKKAAPKKASESSAYRRTVGQASSKRVGEASNKRVGQSSGSTRKYTAEDEYRRKVLGFSDDELSLDLHSDELRKHKKKVRTSLRKKRSKKIKRVVLTLATACVLIAGVMYFWGDSIISRMTGGQVGLLDLFRSAVMKDASQRLKEDSLGRTNVLLFGTSGYDMQGTEGDGKHDGSQLTDSIMLVSLDQDTGDTAMVSVQRDLFVGTCTGIGKINETYWCANQYGDNETAGANALTDVVSNVLGVDIQYYVHVNWQALVSIVDALGGITVTLDEDVQDDWTKTYIKAGEPCPINGTQALGLARARHGTLRGDFTRTASQQKILIALKNKIVERGFSLTELINVASVLGDNVRMNLKAEEIASAARLATSLDLSQMRSVPLASEEKGYYVTTDYINGASYVVPSAGLNNYGDIRDYVKREFSHEVVIKDSPEQAKILVLNGSGMSGIAAAEKQELEASGFTVARIGDAPAGEYMEKFYLYKVSDLPDTTAKLEAYYGVTATEKTEMPYGIDTNGIDFVLILGVDY